MTAVDPGGDKSKLFCAGSFRPRCLRSPLKFSLCDPKGNDVSAANIVVHAVGLIQTNTSESEVIQDAGDSNPDNDFRFDSTLGPSGAYIFNLQTTGLSTGSYQLSFTAGTSTVAQGLTFQVR